MMLRKLKKHFGLGALTLYYSIKIIILKLLVGNLAMSLVLQKSIMPLLLLSRTKAKIGKNVRINNGLLLHDDTGTFENLEIKDDAWIGRNVTIDLTDKVVIGERCEIGIGIMIITHNHIGKSVLSKKYPSETSPVLIGNDSVISWGCTLNKGTVLEERVILMPGTVTSGTLKKNGLYGGNPGRLVMVKE